MNPSDDEPSAGTPNLSLFTDTNSSAEDNETNNNHNSPKIEPIEVTEPQLDNSAKKSSKKRPSGFWTTTTSRKGKKKSKTDKGNYSNDVDTNVLLTPAPKLLEDDTADKTICLSKVFKAEGIDLSDDRLTAGSVKGYRMVRATRGVADGSWYFEIKVKYLGESGHVRLGWCMEKADLQGPVGFDGNGYGYRDIDGGKFHKAVREEYGSEGFKEGDVIGFYINLPNGGEYMPKEAQLVPYKGVKFVCQPDGKEDQPKIVPGSEISFFKNGVCQGVAFKDLCGGRYYPAASMYTLPAQPNCEVTFNFGPHFDFFPNDFVGRPVPRPMIEVPYHGFESLVGGGVSVKK